MEATESEACGLAPTSFAASSGLEGLLLPTVPEVAAARPSWSAWKAHEISKAAKVQQMPITRFNPEDLLVPAIPSAFWWLMRIEFHPE